MVAQSVKTSQIYARVAGLTYIITMALGIFSVNYVEANLIVPENNAATLNNLTANQFLFRIGVAGEILMYLLVILLAFSLYVVLKSVNKNLALLALLWRIGEAIIGSALTVISGLIPIWLLNNGSVSGHEQLQFIIKMFLDLRSSGLNVVLIFIGMGGTIFSFLFFKSKYIPKILAIWGILTYLIILILSFASILIPISETTRMAFYAPGGLFELIFGFWLLIKGVNLQNEELAK